MNFRSSITVILVLSLGLIAGCSFNAERDNPLDPQSVNYQPNSSLSGQVTHKNVSLPLVNALITLNPVSINPLPYHALSASDGFYEFQNLPADDYHLSIELEGYKTQSLEINLKVGENATRNFVLDANPVVDSFSVSTQRLLYNELENIFEWRVYIYSHISDIDDTTDLNACTIKAYWDEDSVQLIKNTINLYTISLDTSYFPNNNIQYLLDTDFNLLMIDKYGDSITTSPSTLHRTIDLEMKIISPSQSKGNGLVSNGIVTFKWATIDTAAYFDFYYRFKLFYYLSGTQRNEFLLTENSPGVTLDTLWREYCFTIPNDSLSDNSYYWTVQLEDIYGDFTRSELNQFEVDAEQ